MSVTSAKSVSYKCKLTFFIDIYDSSYSVCFPLITLPETNSLPLKMIISNSNLLFHEVIFRCHVSFRDSIPKNLMASSSERSHQGNADLNAADHDGFGRPRRASGWPGTPIDPIRKVHESSGFPQCHEK